MPMLGVTPQIAFHPLLGVVAVKRSWVILHRHVVADDGEHRIHVVAPKPPQSQALGLKHQVNLSRIVMLD